MSIKIRYMNMKLTTKLYTWLGALFLVLFTSNIQAQDVLAYWNFNNSPASGVNWSFPINADIGAGNITSNFTDIVSFGGTTINAEDGVSSGGSLVPRSDLNNGNHVDFNISTKGFENIVITYATQRTSTGFTTQTFSYSLDGSTWNPIQVVTDIQGAFVDHGVQTVDLNSFTAINDQDAVTIRITFDGTTTSAGNNRIDNFKVVGTELPVAVNPFTTVWERSRTGENLPTWFGADTERGFAVGNGKVYVASRNGGTNLLVLDAATGVDDGTLSVAGISGGTFAINDAATSEDGVVFAANLTTDALSSSPFKVYTWANSTADPVVALQFTSSVLVRLGDKFNVTGSVADGTAKIWAASATPSLPNVYVWSMTDGAFNATPQVITLSDNLTGGSAAVGPTPDGSFWFSYNGAGVKKYQANGTLIGVVDASVVATGSNATSHVGYTEAGDEIVAVYAHGAGNHNARVLTVPNNDPAAASLIYATPSQGSQANGNGAGDTHTVLNADGSYTVFVFSTNNGIGSYISVPGVIEVPVDPNAPLAGTYYIPQGSNSAGFATLKSGLDALNDRGVSGPVTFLIDDDLNEAAGLHLANVDISAANRFTIKPAPGKSPTITVVGGNPAITENIHSGISFFNTSNVTVDGSNEPDGTSRDMTILYNNAAASGEFGVVNVVGNAHDVEVKNLVLGYTNAPNTIAGLRTRRGNDGVNAPSGLLFQNNKIGSETTPVKDGVIVTGMDINLPTNASVIGNDIHANHRGITTFFVKDVDFSDNRIHVTGTHLNSAWYGGIYLISDGVTTVSGNEIVMNGLNRTTTASYAAGILFNANFGEINVFNNTISVPNLTNIGAVTNNRAHGFVLNNIGGGADVNVVHNTVRIGSSAQTGLFSAFGFEVASTATEWTIVNNIFSNERDASNSYGIHWPTTNTSLTADYNNFHVTGAASVGFFNALATATLTDWQTASGQDANSTFAPVEFVSTTDLRVTGASIGDQNLAGIPIAAVPTDIDGNVRSLENPYKGAFESDAITTSMEQLQTAKEFKLNQNYPNPFNPTTTISFVLPTASNVTLQVYTVTGQLVATLVNESRAAGEHSVTFNASNLSSGVYIYRITAGSFTQTQRMTLVK
jgi:hypothetical protein